MTFIYFLFLSLYHNGSFSAFFFLKKFLFYFWMHWTFLAVFGHPIVAVRGLRIALASPAVEHSL